MTATQARREILSWGSRSHSPPRPVTASVAATGRPTGRPNRSSQRGRIQTAAFRPPKSSPTRSAPISNKSRVLSLVTYIPRAGLASVTKRSFALCHNGLGNTQNPPCRARSTPDKLSWHGRHPGPCHEALGLTLVSASSKLHRILVPQPVAHAHLARRGTWCTLVHTEPGQRFRCAAAARLVEPAYRACRTTGLRSSDE